MGPLLSGAAATAAWAVYLAAGVAACGAAAACDVRTREIPRAASHVLAGAGIAYHALTAGPAAALAAALAALAAFAVLGAVSRRAPAAFGMGDARMCAAVCAYLGVVPRAGVSALAAGLLAACAAALVVLAALKAAGRITRRSTVPLAPALACWALTGAIAAQVAPLV